MSVQYFTKEGLEKLKAELNDLKTVQRPRISAQIAEARDKGDLSENAEYDAAKEAQGMLEARINQTESLVSTARLLENSMVDTSKVMVLSSVKVKNHNSKSTVTYQLVSETEADFKTGKISVKSPIGLGLLGKKVGEVAEVTVPAGTIKLEVIEIS
ncbi:MAG: transcription elongation factor GreA [Flavobacteriaceae bacterium]|nr:transcription elongation factor GreA [Flavobacteriaceae bacterium]